MLRVLKSSSVVCRASAADRTQDVPRVITYKAQRQMKFTRRSTALILTSLILPASQAKALIPDDDDEELVDLAKSRRKERLAADRKIGQNFVKEGDYSGSLVGKVQNAVNRLAKDGLSLESGDLKSLAGSASESWVSDLRKAVGDLSKTDAAQKSSSKVLSSLDEMGQAFSGKDIDKAKTSFEGAVAALTSWASDAGIAKQLKGL